MTDITRKTLIRLAFSLFFYVLVLGFVFLGHNSAPSSVCGPGADFMAILFGIIGSVVLCIKNIVQVANGQKTRVPSLVLHLLISGGFILGMCFS
ncbi:hypothetical protein QNI19_02640 [Cytophagaceae bacterium DM2B3-1]|uniref:Uncharacterized protein n=1 Tax=Xanthocytophaga flava TaxID=3048013 RepID=A0ABT7CFF3_9BACT|nr:hypothetical protein [Xanthocytophaga flavus]MDJ1491812.1 hypothetical protein [Xanthocytophaga flavus]